MCFLTKKEKMDFYGMGWAAGYLTATRELTDRIERLEKENLAWKLLFKKVEDDYAVLVEKLLLIGRKG